MHVAEHGSSKLTSWSAFLPATAVRHAQSAGKVTVCQCMHTIKGQPTCRADVLADLGGRDQHLRSGHIVVRHKHQLEQVTDVRVVVYLVPHRAHLCAPFGGSVEWLRECALEL